MNMRDHLRIIHIELDELVSVVLADDKLAELELVLVRIERVRDSINKAMNACTDKEGYDC
jgi:hypothetical protein